MSIETARLKREAADAARLRDRQSAAAHREAFLRRLEAAVLASIADSDVRLEELRFQLNGDDVSTTLWLGHVGCGHIWSCEVRGGRPGVYRLWAPEGGETEADLFAALHAEAEDEIARHFLRSGPDAPASPTPAWVWAAIVLMALGFLGAVANGLS